MALAWALALLVACGTEATGPAPAPGPDPDAPRHPVRILAPPPSTGIATGERDHRGEPVVADCATCHATRAPERSRRDGGELTVFHQGLHTAHGDLTCLSCHDPDDYGRLHLADDTAIAFTESMRLCAQCHGPQYRDYRHGSHGGMQGHWDRTRGGRTRNHCLSCHDPHAPAFPALRPLPPPPDTVDRHHAAGEGAHHE